MDTFKKYLPAKKVGESNLCTECKHSYSSHKVYPGGKCASCHDAKTGFKCDGFNMGKNVEYTEEEYPWKTYDKRSKN